MTRISYAVVAHPSRAEQAESLAKELGNAPISMDNGYGEGINHDRAWALASAEGSAWSVVLEDDALPIEDFIEQASQALDVAPGPVVSFYTGRSRPPQYQRRIGLALERGTHWIVSDELLHHVAVAIRTDLVGQMLSAVECSTLPADYRIGRWARQCDYPIAYTVPSLVDHEDGPTLIQHQDGQPRTEQRKAWTVGSRPHWNNTTTHL